MRFLWCVSRSEEHTSELQSRLHLVCRLLLEKKNTTHGAPPASTPARPGETARGAPPSAPCVCASPRRGVFRRCHPASPPSFRFFFNDTATTEIYTLSLHDALPISQRPHAPSTVPSSAIARTTSSRWPRDRKSTRLNSSPGYISYAGFCLKKKKTSRLCYIQKIVYQPGGLLSPLVTH